MHSRPVLTARRRLVIKQIQMLNIDRRITHKNGGPLFFQTRRLIWGNSRYIEHCGQRHASEPGRIEEFLE